jgi:hypothetical protein
MLVTLGATLLTVALACPATAKTPAAKTSDTAMNAALDSFFTVEHLIAFEREVAGEYRLTPIAYPRLNVPNAKCEREH